MAHSAATLRGLEAEPTQRFGLAGLMVKLGIIMVLIWILANIADRPALFR
jgi:hypothetical protein